MSLNQVFAINSKQVAHETFEGEVLVINLETGTYYSLIGPSSSLWRMISDGKSVSDVISHFASTQEDNALVIANLVREFLSRLQAEQLILGQEDMALDITDWQTTTLQAAHLPVFEMKVYTDMQDLLLLDPIHDVEDSGWPLAINKPIDPIES